LWNLRDGTSVKTADGVYRHIGADRDDVNLGVETFTNAEKWLKVEKLRLSILVEDESWLLTAPDGQSFILELIDGKISVSKNTINAVSAAASIAAGFGGTAGVAVSGAGAVSKNVILGKTNAHVEYSVLDSGGNVSLNAASTADIASTVVAASLAIGGGGAAGVGVSIGIAVSQNFINWDSDATVPDIGAYIIDSAVVADGALTLAANAEQTINAFVLSGSAAVGVGGAAGIGASGSGVWGENRIDVDVKSFIDGKTGRDDIQVDALTITAEDSSLINAFAGAASLAGSFGGAAGISVAIGVSLAKNTISNEVDAYIANADALTADTTGGITIRATENATIDAISAAASLAAGFGGAAGIAVSGAGAVATNVILTDTHAYITDSVIDSAGKVDIDAVNSATIDATVFSASFSAAIGGAVGVGASIGMSVARNFIGWDPRAATGVTPTATTDDAVRTLNTNDTILVNGGVRDGEIYRYLGDHVDRYNYTHADGQSVAEDDLVFVPDTYTGGYGGGGIYRATEARTIAGNENYTDEDHEKIDGWELVGANAIDFGDSQLWELVVEKNAVEVQAYVLNSNINADGALTLDALGS
jgi:hypothetical protein